MRVRAAAFLLTLVLTPLPGRALEPPRLLADIVPGGAVESQPSLPGDFIPIGGRLLFSTPGSQLGDEGILWSTDGTAAGTVAVSSRLCPSPCDGGIRPLGSVGNIALLVSSSTFRIWRSDGTPVGTFPLSGPLNVFTEVARISPNGPLFFVACDATAGCELWRSDGTRRGTGIVKDLYPGTIGDYPRHLTGWHGRLYFLDETPTQSGLWSTDGTAAGTRFVASSTADLEREENVIAATPSHLFFTSLADTDQLWTTDGTPGGTRLVRAFPARSCPNPHDCPASFLGYLQPIGGEVYFPASDGARVQLWSSDGTPSGTRRLTNAHTDLYPTPPRKVGERWIFTALTGGASPSDALWSAGPGFSNPAPLTGCRGGCPDVISFFPPPVSASTPGRLLFVGSTPAWGSEVWSTDGTARGTRRLTDTCPGPCGSFYTPQPLSAPGERAYFLVRTDPARDDNELWTSDGTPEGTYRVAVSVRGIGALGGRIYHGTSELPGVELRSTDGTPEGDRLVSLLRRENASSFPQITPLGDLALMTTFEGNRGRLWRSDGTPEGTLPLPGPVVNFTSTFFDFGVSGALFPAGCLLYLDVRSVASGQPAWTLWRTDGTAGGTFQVAAAPAGSSTGIDTFLGRDWNGKLLFDVVPFGGDASQPAFRISDGTAAGSRELFTFPSGIHRPTGVEPFGSRFLFVAPVDAAGGAVPQLFLSDGTLAGTRQLTSLQGARGSLYTEFAQTGGTAFFRLLAPGNQDEQVWRTDGTPEGTFQVPLSDLQDPAGLYAFEGAIYFTAHTPAPGYQPGLYRMSSGGGPPILLASVDLELSLSSFGEPPAFVPFEGRLFFTAADREHGRELWATDGTEAGTQRVRDVQPGPGSGSPAELTVAGDLLIFTADDGQHGRELWTSDGTEAGTRLAFDFIPGGFSSHPSSLAVAGGLLFFGADDGTTGVEPWALRLP